MDQYWLRMSPRFPSINTTVLVLYSLLFVQISFCARPKAREDTTIGRKVENVTTLEPIDFQDAWESGNKQVANKKGGKQLKNAANIKHVLSAGTVSSFQRENTVAKTHFAFDFWNVVQLNKKFSSVENKCLEKKSAINASDSDIPYQVILRREFNNGRRWLSFCSSAIITERHVITAAHCFEIITKSTLDMTRVIAGSERSDVRLFGNDELRQALLRELEAVEVWRRIDNCYKHAEYNEKTGLNDIAILELEADLPFSKKINPIRMISHDMEIPQGTLCLSSKYGLRAKKRSPSLQYNCVPIVAYNTCKTIYGERIGSNVSQVCAGSFGKDNCQGDSGGPLACLGVLVGIVTFGGDCAASPVVYTLLSNYTKGDKVRFRASSFAISVMRTCLLKIVIVIVLLVTMFLL